MVKTNGRRDGVCLQCPMFFSSIFFCISFSIALCILCSSMHLSGVQIRHNTLAYLIRMLNICSCMTYVGRSIRENQSSCLFESKIYCTNPGRREISKNTLLIPTGTLATQQNHAFLLDFCD